MKTEMVGCRVNGEWAVVTIHRPEKRNALNRAVREGLLATLRELPDGCRVVVLTGADPAFCAGLDVSERGATSGGDGGSNPSEETLELNLAIRQHPAIFIGAVNGIAIGAGVTLVNSCDLALAADKAEFWCPELLSGRYASMAGPTSLLTVSRKRAAWLLLTTERVDANTAREWGLVNQVVPGDELLDRTCSLAERVSQFDGEALRAIKQSIDDVPAGVRDWSAAMWYGQRLSRRVVSARHGP